MDEQLISDLTTYLEDDEQTARVIPLAVKRAIRSFQKKRNYPESYTEENINKDMDKCYDCIFDLALYFLVKQGVEFETSHSENSVNAGWNSETEIFVNHGVFPFARGI